jgi:hypothetical protein
VGIGNEILQEISNDNGVRLVNFPTHRILIVKSKCSHPVTFLNLLGRSHNKNDCNLIDGIQIYLIYDHSGQQIILTWHKQAVSKQTAQISYADVQSQKFK